MCRKATIGVVAGGAGVEAASAAGIAVAGEIAAAIDAKVLFR